MVHFYATGVVLEKNPEKQGLKRWGDRQRAGPGAVLEKNPEKQGLKQHRRRSRGRLDSTVLEKNPEKQGLKLSTLKHLDDSLGKF